MKTVKINLYQFEELEKFAQLRAVYDHQNFLDSEPLEQEDESGDIEEYYHKHTDEETKENILLNQYHFFKSGKLAEVTTYTGKHPKTGKEELFFETQIIEL
jgi:hypothetical protein